VRYPSRSKHGNHHANVESARQHAEESGEFREYLKQLTSDWQAPARVAKKSERGRT
jgi:hypothetical protein